MAMKYQHTATEKALRKEGDQGGSGRPGVWLKQYRHLKRRWEQYGAGMDGVNLSRVRTLTLDKITTSNALFQPRLLEDYAQEIEEHIDTLRRLLLADGPNADTHRNGFDALLVFPIAGVYYVLDGHCRYSALTRVKWSRAVKVEVFSGTFDEAVTESRARNSEVRKTWHPAERAENAWRDIVRNELLPEAERRTVEVIAESLSLPSRRLFSMQRIVREGGGGHPATVLMELKWSQVRKILKGRSDTTDEAKIERLARTLKKAVGRQERELVKLFWPAFREAFGPEKTRNVVMCIYSKELEVVLKMLNATEADDTVSDDDNDF